MQQKERIEEMLKYALIDVVLAFNEFQKEILERPELMLYTGNRMPEVKFKRKLKNIAMDVSNDLSNVIRIELDRPRIEYNQTKSYLCQNIHLNLENAANSKCEGF